MVTRVDYRLTRGGAPTIRYAELRQAILKGRDEADLAGVGLAEVAETVRGLRRAKGMLLVEGDADCRSAGSFFKNPVVSEEQRAADCGGEREVAAEFSSGAGPSEDSCGLAD